MSSPRASVPPRQVVFVDEDYRQNNPKKRPAERACDKCRRQKKRCIHENGSEPLRSSARSVAFPAPTTGKSSATVPSQIPTASRTTESETGRIERSSISSVTPKPSVSRFIGDLNPERELRTPSSRTGETYENNVGLWHYDAPESTVSASIPNDFGPTSLFHHCSPLTRRLLLPIMDQECLGVLPPSNHLEALESFYFENVHPIIPAVDRATYEANPSGSPAHTLQSQALCLAAHANPSVRDHLRLQHQDGPIPLGLFARRVLGAMRLNIELALTTDKEVLIRTLATMSIFAYTADGLELSCQFFNRSVHLMFTIGLHQKRSGEQDEHMLDGLYCYVWALDKLHAAMQGRPVAIHERDMAVTIFDRSSNLDPGFKVFLRVAVLLGQVIDLYRPKSTMNEIPSLDILSFEQLLRLSGALALPSQICDSLELFYNSAVILSCRRRPTTSEHDSEVPNARQTHAASQILTILEEDIMQTTILLPHVPYAVSLALSTAYRQIRHSQLPKTHSRARRQVHQCLRHLKSMSEAFWSAAVMAELARKALVETKTMGQDQNESGLQPDISGEAAVSRTAPSSRRPSLFGTGYLTTNGDLSGFEWHCYQEPGESPLFDLGSDFWDYSGLDGLLDANLELNLPSFLPETYGSVQRVGNVP